MKPRKGDFGRNQFFMAHCLGNDYVVLKDDDIDFEISPRIVQLICNRHHGLGSDGLLLDVGSTCGEFAVRIFNPDGSEAEKSGNGIRIFACYLFLTGQTTDTEFTIKTVGGIVSVRLELNERHDVIGAAVSMGKATFAPEDLPCNFLAEELLLQPIEAAGRSLLFSGVSVGNPHCVLFASSSSIWTRQDLLQLGPVLERHPIFPHRVNVQLAKVESRDSIRILIWERGAGETEASGSSACATAAAGVRLGLVESPVAVHAPGGTQYVVVDSSFRLVLTGPVTAVASGSFCSSFISYLSPTLPAAGPG